MIDWLRNQARSPQNNKSLQHQSGQISVGGGYQPSDGQKAPKLRETRPEQVTMLPTTANSTPSFPSWSIPGKYRVGSGSWWGAPPTTPQSCSLVLKQRSNIHTCTRTKRSVCTQHWRVFFDVRAVFKMSLGCRTAASAMAAVQQGASEARSYCQTHPGWVS